MNSGFGQVIAWGRGPGFIFFSAIRAVDAVCVCVGSPGTKGNN